MATGPHNELRIKGAKHVAQCAQEMGWAMNEPLGRIDWQPDPETEAKDNLAEAYLLTLATDRRHVHQTISADTLERLAIAKDAEVNALIEDLVTGLKH